MCHSCAVFAPAAPSERLRDAALELLVSVDDGEPIAAPARALAVGALREARPDSKPWLLAVAVLEGGPLRARNAVALAGLALEAEEAVEPSAEGVSTRATSGGKGI